MTPLAELLKKAHILPHLPARLTAGQTCFLVGGALRDVLIGRIPWDFDFTTPGDPTRLAKGFSSAIGGRWFMLDQPRKQSRVVLKTEAGLLSYDFAPFRGATVEEDLHGRDFTVNALAIELAGDSLGTSILDPLGGQNDLKQGLLRACSQEAFQEDPLRVLRGIRLAATLNLRLAPQTATLMADSASRLNGVSAERIRNELSVIFAADTLAPLRQMHSLRLFNILFGVDADYVRAIAEVERFSARYRKYAPLLPELATQDAGEQELSLFGCLRLAVLLSTGQLLQRDPLLLKRLRFSNRSDGLIRRLDRLGQRQIEELQNLPPTERGRAQWVCRLGPMPLVGLIYLLCLADFSEGLLNSVRGLAKDYRQSLVNGRIPDLVSGTWIASELGIPRGKDIGVCLEKLRLAEIAGEVRSRSDAHKFLKSLAEKMIDKQIDPS